MVMGSSSKVITTYEQFVTLFRHISEHSPDGKEVSERLLSTWQGGHRAAKNALEFHILAAKRIEWPRPQGRVSEGTQWGGADGNGLSRWRDLPGWTYWFSHSPRQSAPGLAPYEGRVDCKATGLPCTIISIAQLTSSQGPHLHAAKFIPCQ